MSEQEMCTRDSAASSFDQAADHGLGDPDVRSAWAALLTRVLPTPPSRLADLGCGTGSLTILASDLGHEVDGVDFSEEMLVVARSKAKGRNAVRFHAGDAAAPPLPEHAFDTVLCRHVLWALPNPVTALQAWSRLLRPGGRLVLVEGSWSTGAGLSSQQIVTLLQEQGWESRVEPLVDPRYWGGPINDDRYVAVGYRAASQVDG